MFGNIVLFKNLGFTLEKSSKYVLFVILVTTICYMLASYSSYYISNMEVYMMLVSVLLLSTFKRNMLSLTENKKVRPLFIASFFIYFIITIVIHGEKPSVGVLCAILMGYYVLSLKPKYKIWLFDRFTTLIAILFGLCVLEFVLAVFLGISCIKHTPIYRFDTDAHYFYQGIITIFPYYYQFGLARFQAFTEEPGLVGTLCAFMLACLNIKEYKWQMAVFIMCGILSMSLAFYLIFVMWVVYNSLNMKNAKYNLLLLVFIVAVCFLAQNEITELVTGRIAEKGSISGLDNRSTETFKKAFDDFLTSSDVVLGRGLRTFHTMFDHTGDSGGNAGAKTFIYSYGLFSMILLFVTYTKCFLESNGRNTKSFFILLIFWLSFYQREYWFTPYNLIPLFMYGAYDSYISQIKNK